MTILAGIVTHTLPGSIIEAFPASFPYSSRPVGKRALGKSKQVLPATTKVVRNEIKVLPDVAKGLENALKPVVPPANRANGVRRPAPVLFGCNQANVLRRDCTTQKVERVVWATTLV